MAFVGFEAGGLPGDPYTQHFYAPAAYGYYAAAPAAAPPMPAGALTGRCSRFWRSVEEKGWHAEARAVTGSCWSSVVVGAGAPGRLPADRVPLRPACRRRGAYSLHHWLPRGCAGAGAEQYAAVPARLRGAAALGAAEGRLGPHCGRSEGSCRSTCLPLYASQQKSRPRLSLSAAVEGVQRVNSNGMPCACHVAAMQPTVLSAPWPSPVPCINLQASQMHFRNGQAQGFALFASGSLARAAVDAIQNLVFDNDSVLRAEMAHKNMWVLRRAALLGAAPGCTRGFLVLHGCTRVLDSMWVRLAALPGCSSP